MAANMVRRPLNLLILSAMCFLSPGCGSPQRGPAVPMELQDRATVKGMTPAIRCWGAEVNPEFEAEILRSLERERAHLSKTGHSGPLPCAHFLAISGGGPDGAFGAGLLNGWTAAGNRPEFKVVTGISTGALCAPFAFLGARHDATLKRFYTQTKSSDILEPRSVLAGFTMDAMADNAPLARILSEIVNEELLREIQAEHEKGRILLILTTNIDARRAVIWNVTAIAATGQPSALPLIRKIMLASAAIPAAFPPSLFDVEADGKNYQEMHVDGGCMTQVFLYPPSFRIKEESARQGISRERRLYIIRNGRIASEWAATPRKTMAIAGRAISSLIQTQGIGDLYRIYVGAERDGIDYNVAFIPASFNVKAKEEFDPAYMTALFDLGFDKARAGYPWSKTPPLLESTEK